MEDFVPTFRTAFHAVGGAFGWKAIWKVGGDVTFKFPSYFSKDVFVFVSVSHDPTFHPTKAEEKLDGKFDRVNKA